MLDLILPLECGGCGAPSTRWCDACARELSVGIDEPRVVNPRVDPQVPVFALGRYAESAATITDTIVKESTAPAFATINTVLQDQLELAFHGQSSATTISAIAKKVTAALG